MTDRRRSDDYKQISGYIPLNLALEFKSICAGLGISQSDAIEEMIQEWIAQKMGSHSINAGKAAPKNIADLVRANMAQLKRCGIKNLPALAKGEVLPTSGDFAIITSALAIPEEERQEIWQETFQISVYQSAKSMNIYNNPGGVKEDECEYS